jgi:LPXTG-site transpeptidase (sortase) family protein
MLTKKIFAFFITAVLITTCGIISATAADYTFKEKDNTDFYRPTPYEDIYGSQYNYGGQNAIDFYDPLALPGLVSPTPQTVPAYNGAVVDTPVSYGLYDSGAPLGGSSDFTSYTKPIETPKFTSVNGLKRSDGSIGTLAIPSLSINMKAFEGTTSASMSKGVGHFAETSGWDGNIGLAGHNRNSKYTIGAIKDLKIGDTIRYTTVLGTRTYSVSFVGTISHTDWSRLSATADNRITIITCLAGQPTLRVCVAAIESR